MHGRGIYKLDDTMKETERERKRRPCSEKQIMKRKGDGENKERRMRHAS